MIEKPANLRPGKIWIEDESRAFAKERLVFAQCVARRGRAPILPDDGVCDRLARLAVPEDRRLALIRDSDRRDLAIRADLFRDRELTGCDLARVVLHPTGPRIDLLQLALRRRDDVTLRVEHDRARAR